MKLKRVPIDKAIGVLESNFDSLARVTEWAEVMGYRSSKIFRKDFIRYYQIPPGKTLTRMRLIHIIGSLEKGEQVSCNEVAWKHSMKDHNELYGFVKYHTGYSPTDIKQMDPEKRRELTNKLIKKYSA